MGNVFFPAANCCPSLVAVSASELPADHLGAERVVRGSLLQGAQSFTDAAGRSAGSWRILTAVLLPAGLFFSRFAIRRAKREGFADASTEVAPSAGAPREVAPTLAASRRRRERIDVPRERRRCQVDTPGGRLSNRSAAAVFRVRIPLQSRPRRASWPSTFLHPRPVKRFASRTVRCDRPRYVPIDPLHRRVTGSAPTSGPPRSAWWTPRWRRSYERQAQGHHLVRECYAGEKADRELRRVAARGFGRTRCKRAPRGDQGAADHSGRRRYPQPQRGAAPPAGPVRVRAPGAPPARVCPRRCCVPQDLNVRDLPREHRGRLLPAIEWAVRYSDEAKKLIDFLDSEHGQEACVPTRASASSRSRPSVHEAPGLGMAIRYAAAPQPRLA